MENFTYKLPAMYKDCECAFLRATYNSTIKMLSVYITIGNKTADGVIQQQITGREVIRLGVEKLSRINSKKMLLLQQWLERNSKQLVETYYEFITSGNFDFLEQLKHDIRQYPNDIL